MSRRRRYWRYEVDEVWGFEDRPKPPVEVGDVIVDHWKADRTWNIYKTSAAAYVGGWHAKLLGEWDGPVDAAGQPMSEPAVTGG